MTTTVALTHLRPPHIYGALDCRCGGDGRCAGMVPFIGRLPGQVQRSTRLERLFEALAEVLQSAGVEGFMLEYDRLEHAIRATSKPELLSELRRRVEAADRPRSGPARVD